MYLPPIYTPTSWGERDSRKMILEAKTIYPMFRVSPRKVIGLQQGSFIFSTMDLIYFMGEKL